MEKFVKFIKWAIDRLKFWIGIFVCFYIYRINVWIIHKIKKQKIIFILSTPRHGNLGDHAIVYSQYKLFKELGYSKNIVEINTNVYSFFKNKIARWSDPDDLIIIDGGGNIGTLWIREEALMRDIISLHKNNAIIIMPQTAYFEDTPYGKSELQKSIEIYCGHPDLTIFCRDSDTFKLISEEFKSVNSYYVPDMVMFLSDVSFKTKRSGAMLCLREDPERICSSEIEEKIVAYICCQNGIEIRKGTTFVDRLVSPRQRKKLLFEKWREFSEAEFVVTDRLHGMIFSAITATPCLALDNISHKVKNGYKWLEKLPYIIFCDCDDSLKDKLNMLMKISKCCYSYDFSSVADGYKTIKRIVQSKLD